MTLNEANLKKAYFETIACTGIGAAVNNGELLLSKNVLVTVPEVMHEDYPARLLGCAIKVCSNDPYLWTVQNIEPAIDLDTTFQSLWEDWIMEIVTG